jgi:hypothetical protein
MIAAAEHCSKEPGVMGKLFAVLKRATALSAQRQNR